MTKIELAGVNMFTNRKVARRFIDIHTGHVEDGGKGAGVKYRDAITSLFWKKQESVDGEYTEFKINERDLMETVIELNK